jgi:hypothetical protein
MIQMHESSHWVLEKSMSGKVTEEKIFMQVLQADLKQYTVTCAELQRSVRAHKQLTDDAYSEVSKGNSIIECLSRELAACEERVRRKQAVICCQVRPETCSTPICMAEFYLQCCKPSLLLLNILIPWYVTTGGAN